MTGDLYPIDREGLSHRDASGPLCHWLPALAACIAAIPGMHSQPAAARACGQLRLLDRDDWQLADIDVLQRLIRYDHPAALLDPRLFGGTLRPEWCWSASPSAWSPQLGWGIAPENGQLTVRPASELGIGIAVLHDYLPTTGNRTGKPALVLDAAPRSLGPDGRCCSNAATDKAAVYLPASGLIVAPTALRLRATQADCARACAALAWCDWHDWRLPNIEEFASLVDRHHYRPAAPALDGVTLRPDWYWAAHRPSWEHAAVGWYADLEDGYIGYQERDYGGLALAVRSGQPRD